MQTSVGGGDIDLALPYGDAAVDQVATWMSAGEIVGLRVVAPQLPTGGGIYGVDIAPGSRGVHDTVDDDGRRFLAAHRQAQVVLPGEAEPRDVVRVDVLQGRVVAAVLVAPGGEPVLRFRIRRQQPCGVDAAGCPLRSRRSYWRGCRC